MKTLKHLFFFTILIFIGFYGCKKIEHSNEAPLITTGDTSNIQLTSATITGIVTPNAAPITTSGHVWSSVNQLPSLSANEGKTTANGLLPENKIISNLTNLTPGTVYYVRGYVISNADTIYGNVLTFVTVSFQGANLTTGAVSNITLTSANVAASITSIGNNPVTQYGHVWSSVNSTPTTADLLTTLGPLPGPASYSSSLPNLSIGTLYYVRAYASNSAGTVYGNVVTFTTLSNNPPTITTGSISSITINSASAAGNITDIGSSNVTQYGHVWSSNPIPTISDNKTQLGTTGAPIAFNSVLTGLLPSTIYYVRAYATNSGGTTYGAVVSFTTGTPANNPASVTTGSISNITLNTASAAGNITDIGSSTVTQYGHVWSTNPTPTISDNKTQLGTTGAPIAFSSSLTGLLPSTIYYVRAYATNSGGTTYGAVVSFTTATPANNPASVTTGSISNITLNTASAAGNITDIGSSTVTQYGHVWSSTNTNPTTADSKTDLGTTSSPLAFNSALTGLQSSTIYYVRAYATNSGGTTYGAVMSFTTATPSNNPAAVTTGSISSITVNSANAAGNISDIGSSPVTQYGHVWSSTNTTPTTADSKTDLGTTSTATGFNSSLTGLQSSTTYFVRAYATNSAGTTYGGVVSFTTGAAPNNPATVTTDSVRQITLNSATAYGNITSIGNSTVTQYGHVWSSTNTLPTINDSKTQLGSANAPLIFNSSLTGLTSSTIYYVRSYTINSGGTTYGAVISFTTASPANNPASVTTGFVGNITPSTADVGGNITDIGSSTITQYGHVWSTNPTPTISDNKTQLGTTNAPIAFNSVMTGLLPSTTYYVRAYATNAGGTTYGAIVSFTTAPASPNNAPTVTTDSVRQITVNSATAYGNITSIGNSTVTQYGHVWSSTNTLPTINDTKSQLGTTNAPLIFNSQLSGLTRNTTYYVRSYAVNNGGIAYGAVISFTTQDYTLAFVESIDVINITQTTASARASIFSTGNTPVTQHGHVYSITNPTPGLTDSKTLLGAAGTGVFTSNLTGLQPGTRYYIRPYATNLAGTAFGTTITFTTAASNPPTVTTNTISNIAFTSANAGGSITSIGSTTVTQYGHVWSSTNSVPTINDSKTQLGTASGPLTYTSSLLGLTSITTYYVRAYAINNGGITYGAVVTFITQG